MRDDLDLLRSTVESVFEGIHRRVFLGDPAANPRLRVEVVGASTVEDTPTVVLVTPWTLNGLAFPPDGVLAASLHLGSRDVPVFPNDLPELGPYQSVNLVADVSWLQSPAAARTLALSLQPEFEAAVGAARRAALAPH